jgi:hypothetical protein
MKRLWQMWKRLARRIGDFQARLLLTLIYIVAILPFGLGVRLFGDPLRLKRRPDRWLDRPEEPADLNWARRQW